MKKLVLIAILGLLSQAAFAVIVTNGAACKAAGAVASNGTQQVVCTNGVWVAPAARAAVGAAVLGADGTVNNTIVRSPTVVAPGAAAVAGAPAARAAARVPGTPATRAAVRTPAGVGRVGTPATRTRARARR